MISLRRRLRVPTERLIIAALETCCRQGELLSLQWRDVSLGRGELILRAEKTKTSTDHVSRRLKNPRKPRTNRLKPESLARSLQATPPATHWHLATPPNLQGIRR